MSTDMIGCESFVDAILIISPQYLTTDDMEFIISAQRTYCTSTDHCHSFYSSINNVDMTVLETRLKRQISIAPADCCEPCDCDKVCCCNTDSKNYINDDENQLSCFNPQMKIWHRNRNSYPDSKDSYLIRTVCSSQRKCYNIQGKNRILTPPVFDNQNNVTYLNQVCAECNNRSMDNLVQWDASVECRYGTFQASTSENLMAEKINSSGCNLIFYPPENVMKSKCQPMIEHCNVTGKWALYDPVIERACRLYTARYAQLYKNMFCYICNKKTEDDPLNKCVPDQSNPIPSGKTLRMLLRSDVADIEVESPNDDIERSRYCVSKTIYDSLQKRCVTATCMSPNVFLKGRCVNVAKRIGGVIYRMFLVLLPRFTVDNASLTSEVDRIEAHFTAWLDTIELLGNLGILSIHVKAQPSRNKQESNGQFLVVHLEIYIKEKYVDLVETTKIDRLMSIKNTDIDVRVSSTCGSKRYFVYFDHFDISHNSMFSNVTLREEKKKGTFLKRVKESSSYTSQPKVSVMNLYPTSVCPLMKLNDSFYNISISSFGIFIGRLNVNLNKSEYIMIQSDSLYGSEESVFICLETFIRFTGNIENSGPILYKTALVALILASSTFIFQL